MGRQGSSNIWSQNKPQSVDSEKTKIDGFLIKGVITATKKQNKMRPREAVQPNG